ncbi:hypothetical protein [Pasteurella multocida]|uniref:hypothetical protein n=1 Tax=Pasteurella multocida TaxID=747 RepID=UPI002FDFDA20
MADITIQCITPRHFFESVKLIKELPPSIKFSHNAMTISFDSDDDIFDRIYHLYHFIRELENSSVPVDLGEFVKKYRKMPNQRYFKR